MNSRLKLAGGAALLVLAMASTNAVYAQETTSSIAGRVTANDAPVAGAAVTIVHTPSGTRSSTVTNADGGFSSRGLRVGGPYTVTVTAPGLPARSFNDIYLNVAETFNLPAEVAIAEVDAVEIVATAAAAREVGPSTVLGRDTIESVVSVTRDIRDLARRDALVSQNVRGDGGISIAGSNPRTNRVTIDGVAAQDPYGLETGGLATSRGPISLDAVDQFSIVAVPTDVENGNFSGGALNIVLRSGTNNFHGSLFVNYLNEGFQGRNVGPTRVASLISQENYGAFLGGPIIPDKLFFALSYETYQSFGLNGTGPAGEGYANAYINGLTRATIDQIRGIYDNQYASDYPILDTIRSAPITDKKYSAKFDWNITDQHRASLTYRVSESSNTSFGGNSQTVAALYSNLYIASYKDVGTTLEVNSDWTDKFSTVFRATYRDWDKGQDPPGGQNFSEVSVCARATSGATPQTACPNGTSVVRFGPDLNRHANQLNIEEAQFQLNGTYQLTGNRLKFGVQANHKDVYNVFVPNARGTYYFDSIADFQAGRANRLTYQDAVSGNTQDAAALFDYWVGSVYLQDTMEITPDFSVTAGFRYDRLFMDQIPIRNPNFVAREGFANNLTLDGYDVVMPRVSAEWTPFAGLKLTGGFGRFSGGYPEVLFATPFYNTGYQTSQVQINRTGANTFTESSNTGGFTQAVGAAALNGLNLDPKFGLAMNSTVRALQQGQLGGTIPPLNSTIALSPAFELPSEWKAYLSGQWSVFDGWRLSADYIKASTEDAITYRDYRAQPLIVNGVRATTPDGRLRYDNLNATAAQRAQQGITSVAPTNNSPELDLVAENVDKGDSWIASVGLAKSFGFGVDFSASYAKQRANEVNAGLRFGTTQSSLYQNVPAGLDPAYDSFGRSIEEIQDRFKLELGYRKKFFGDNETRISFFGERFSGRPFGFSMNDTTTSGRNRTFGVARFNHLLYVPDIAGDSNTSDLNVGLVTFANNSGGTQTGAQARDLFLGYVKQFGLANGQILEKNSNTNKDISRLDMQISQELPSIVEGHKFKLQFDVRNVLNLIDRDWGKVREYGTGSSGGGGEILARAQCADANGVAVAASSPVCARYIYTDVPTTIAPLTNTAASLWAVQVSLRYEF